MTATRRDEVLVDMGSGSRWLGEVVILQPMNAPPIAEPVSPKGSHFGLYLLLGAIVLGVVVGAFYGRRMWLPSGGQKVALEKLAETRKKKAVHPPQQPAAAEHLQRQLETI